MKTIFWVLIILVILLSIYLPNVVRYGNDPTVADIPKYLKQVEQPEPPKRANAVANLAEVLQGPSGESISNRQREAIFDAFKSACKDSDPVVRCYAITAIIHSGFEDELVIPILLEATSDPHEWARADVVVGLASYAERHAELLPVIFSFLDDPSDVVRQYAIETIGTLGPDADEMIPELLEMLKSCEAYAYRGYLIKALGEISAGQPLGEVFDKLNSGDVAQSLDAIREIKDGESSYDFKIDALTIAANNNQKEVSDAAVRALGEICVDYTEIVPTLVILLGPIDDDRDSASRDVLVSIASSPGVMETLIGQLNSDCDRRYVIQVIFALRTIGHEAKAAIPALEQLAAASIDSEIQEEAEFTIRYLKVK